MNMSLIDDAIVKMDTSLRAINARLEQAERMRKQNEQQEFRIARQKSMDAMTANQLRWDEAFSPWNRRCPEPRADELSGDFARRVCRVAKKYLPITSELNNLNFSQMDDNILSKFEPRLRGELAAAARNPSTVPENTLREISSIDQKTGARVTEFVGQKPFVLMEGYGYRPGRRLVNFIGRDGRGIMY
jgi:hypothetical protein